MTGTGFNFGGETDESDRGESKGDDSFHFVMVLKLLQKEDALPALSIQRFSFSRKTFLFTVHSPTTLTKP